MYYICTHFLVKLSKKSIICKYHVLSLLPLLLFPFFPISTLTWLEEKEKGSLKGAKRVIESLFSSRKHKKSSRWWSSSSYSCSFSHMRYIPPLLHQDEMQTFSSRVHSLTHPKKGLPLTFSTLFYMDVGMYVCLPCK